MATVNTERFCANAGENYGWEKERVRRFEALLRKESLLGEGIPAEKLSSVIDSFLKKEERGELGEEQ